MNMKLVKIINLIKKILVLKNISNFSIWDGQLSVCFKEINYILYSITDIIEFSNKLTKSVRIRERVALWNATDEKVTNSRYIL